MKRLLCIVFAFLLLGGYKPIASEESADSHEQPRQIRMTFPVSMGSIVDDVLRSAFSNTDNMLGSPGHGVSLFNKLGSGSAANGTFFGSGIAFMNITTYAADKFFHIQYILSFT